MKTIIYINLDGFSYSYYELAKKAGKTQIFDQLAQDGFLFQNLRSGIISITNPMQGAILSGAWSNKTHNFYQHYDSDTKQIVKHLRTDDAENVAAAYLRNNLSAISIHQFMLENRPCRYDVKDRAYFKTEKMPSNYLPRLEILKQILSKQPVKSKDESFVYDVLPEFIAVYIDDLDSLGHNNAEYDGFPIRSRIEERQEDIINRMVLIQEKLLEIVDHCKNSGIYEDLVFLVTTDHGMTKFEGNSSMGDLIQRINALGIKASLVKDRTEDNEVILLPYDIECSVYFEKALNAEKQAKLTSLLYSLDYAYVVPKKSLREVYQMDERGPEFLLSAKPYHHFYHRDYPVGTYGAAHDSMDETSQHIFGLLFGSDVRKQSIYPHSVHAIDLIPSVAKAVHGITLQDATGRIIPDLFVGKESK